MRFPAKHSEDFAPVPAGAHVAICTGVIDLGLQPGSTQYPDPKPQVYLRFELPGERIKYTKDGRETEGPMSIGRTFTASMGTKANLRKFVESWRGASFTDAQAADFDFKNLLGHRCLLNVTHKQTPDRIYANIMTATPLPKGMTSTDPQHNASVYYSLEEPNPAVFAALPDWLKKKITERLQPEQHDSDPGYDKRDMAIAGELSGADDDIPF